MPTEVNWEPFLFTLEICAAFVGICFLAALSDLWAKGRRKGQKPSAVVWRNGEQVFLN